MREGCKRRMERIEDVLVMRGIVKRLARASRRNALRIVEPDWEGDGTIGGLVAGEYEEGIVKCCSVEYRY